MDPSVRLTHLNCKCCNKRLKSTSILKHLSQKTKLNCINSYTEEELKLLKETSTKRTKVKISKWRKKNKQYYANHRKVYYEANKYKLAKKESDHYAKTKKKLQYYHRNKDSKKKAEYYKETKDRKLYNSNFNYLMKKMRYEYASPENVQIFVSGFHKRCHEANEKFQEKLKDMKGKKTIQGWKNKSMKFLELEIETTVSTLISIVKETFEKFKSCYKKYDNRLRLEIFVLLHTHIEDRLNLIQQLINSFIKGHDSEFIKWKYTFDKEEILIESYNRELVYMKERFIDREKNEVQEKLKKAKIRIEKGHFPWFLKKRGTEIIAFFKSQDITPEIHDRLDRIKKSIESVFSEFQSENDDVVSEVGQIICQWNKNTKKWREKKASDLMFITDMFENQEHHLDNEKMKLWHKLQFNLEDIHREIGAQPPKDLKVEEFFNAIKAKYWHKFDDSDYCITCECSKLDMTE